MEKQFIFNSNKISYFDKGKGNVVVLLHGYLETKEVWSSFAEKLSKNFRVIALDLPGHGKSDVVAETHTMQLLAQFVNSLLLHLNIETCTLVGHSMGGYVMLAFVDLYPEKVERFVLFHSSVYADTDEKKKNRLREIEFIENGKLELIVNTNLPNTFATENLDKFSNEIDILKQHAKTHNPKGVCAILRGMMERPDGQELVKNFAKPMLFIFGEKDNYIPVEVAKKMLMLNPEINVKWLSDSGHMGFVEEQEFSTGFLLNFCC
jgi:pimeloyl-ACP methyl ester carboxylesterase